MVRPLGLGDGPPSHYRHSLSDQLAVQNWHLTWSLPTPCSYLGQLSWWPLASLIQQRNRSYAVCCLLSLALTHSEPGSSILPFLSIL